MIEALVNSAAPQGRYSLASSDLHMGFVSSDMGDGVADGDATVCSERGDDGALHASESCGAREAPFVWHFGGYHDEEASIATAECNAMLEPGCSVPQPLESALSALSGNDGFVRSSPLTGLSLIVVVFITPQDDCSSAPSSAGRLSPVRCARNHALTHAVDRYIDGLRALRPGNEALIRTLTIAGVPQDLLLTAEGQPRDPSWDYPTTEEVLADPRMQVRLAEDGASLEPACTRGDARATPARRLIELAGRLHPSQPQALHSICEPGWADALRNVVHRPLSERTISGLCLPREIARDSEGLTSCKLYWTLPEWFDPEQPLTPVRCDERPFLREVDRAPAGEPGDGAVCEVRQVSIAQDEAGFHVGSGDGFYIDDGSDEALRLCAYSRPMIAFTEGARAPSGVRLELVCSDTAQRYRAPQSEPSEPAIGDPCHARRLELDGPLVERDARCISASDPRLVCQSGSNTCQRSCTEDANCPPAWLCDSEVCFNPSCE
jgi:hypothetical protein